MIKSRHNTFGCWLIFILTILFVTFFLGEIVNHYSLFQIDYFTKLDNRSFYFMISIIGVSIFLFVTLISAYIKQVTIDTIDKTISFKNIVTRHPITYNYEDFDGIVDTFLNHRSASYKTIGLVKDKKIIRFIDSFWVSNYDDLRQSLQDIKNLGTYRLGTWKQLILLFRQTVID